MLILFSRVFLHLTVIWFNRNVCNLWILLRRSFELIFIFEQLNTKWGPSTNFWLYLLQFRTVFLNMSIYLRCHTMSSRDYPSFIQQCPTTRQLLWQKSSLNQRRLPRMRPESCWMSTHNPVAPRVQFTATWNREHLKTVLIIIVNKLVMMQPERKKERKKEGLSAKTMRAIWIIRVWNWASKSNAGKSEEFRMRCDVLLCFSFSFAPDASLLVC